MPRVPHTSCYRGKRVRLILRDGRRLEGRFRERTDRWVLLEGHGRVPKERIRAFIILKKGTDE